MDQNLNPNPVLSPAPDPSNASSSSKPQLPGFSEIFRSAWGQFKQNWPTFFGISILPFVFSFVFGFVIKMTGAYFNFGIIITYSIIYALIYILSIISVSLVVTSKINPPSFSSAYKNSFGFLLSFAWIGILSSLAAFGGTLLLVIPGVIISILLIFSSFAYFTEGKKGLNALIFSWYYARNYKLAVFGRLFLFGLIIMAVSIVVGILAFFSEEVLNFVTALLSAIYLPLSTIFSFAIFQSLKQIVPPPSPEDETKIKSKIKIFSILGIVAIVGFIIAFGTYFQNK